MNGCVELPIVKYFKIINETTIGKQLDLPEIGPAGGMELGLERKVVVMKEKKKQK